MREKLGSELLIGQESLKGFLHSPLKIFVGIELRPPSRTGGEKIFFTQVGEPFNPNFCGSAWMSSALQTFTSDRRERISKGREARLGLASSNSAVTKAGKGPRITSVPPSTFL